MQMRHNFFAINEAFLIFANSKWCSNAGLIIESDSLNAVRWFNNKELIPWRLKRHNYWIDYWKNAISDWKITHTHRESNSMTDSLAMAEVNCLDNFLVFL
ncbi:hypothetical protein REPUB_Repub05bG0048400 [Reevesia pubescens]